MSTKYTSTILALKFFKAKVKVLFSFVLLTSAVYIILLMSRGKKDAHVTALRSVTMDQKNASVTWINTAAAPQGLWYSSILESSRSKSVGDETQHGGGSFQPINEYEAWVYSAFFDVINDTYIIRIFGLQNTQIRHQVFCHVIDNLKVTKIEGRKEFLPDGHNLSFCGTTYICELGEQTGSQPHKVALTFVAQDMPTNLLRVLYPRARQRKFTVCHAALFRYHNAVQLVQSIEINRVFGAEHFYVYNHSVSNTTDAVLRHYQSLGLLTVMQWPLPSVQVWYFCQNVVINDCVYRNRMTSEYVVIQDTDEFIVPSLNNSWGELIEEVIESTRSRDGLPSPTIASFSVETTFHCGKPNQTQWDDIKREFPMTAEEEQFYRNHSIYAMLNLLRVRRVMMFDRYCKTIVRPELILYAGIHYTHVHRNSSKHTVVKQNLAIVHHYKNRFMPEMVDTTILKYKNVLYPRLRTAFRELPFL